MGVDRKTVETVLSLVPQAPPFRFVDDILELDEDRILGRCCFPHDAWFYRGHFPGNPVTPGVIIIEAMAQTAVVAFGIYLLLLQGKGEEEIRKQMTLFSFLENVDFMDIVRPGESLIVRGEKVYFRRGNLKVKALMEREGGNVVCSGVLAGTSRSIPILDSAG
ncbi:MAG: beta-hydroxyacyl-ACP dehydratase [Syntrophales bacterium]|nr:beta-hydroxyacyl-ACP dehydratase [Syntrophales bacterium]